MHLVPSFKPSLNCCTVLAGGPKQCTMTLLAAHSIMGQIKHSHFTWSIIVELSISLLKIWYYTVISIRFTWAKSKSNSTGTWPSRGVYTRLNEIITFLHVLIKNYNIIILELIFMLAASVFKPKQYDLKDFTCEIYKNEWIGETDVWTLFYVSGLVHQSNIACAHDS